MTSAQASQLIVFCGFGFMLLALCTLILARLLTASVRIANALETLLTKYGVKEK